MIFPPFLSEETSLNGLELLTSLAFLAKAAKAIVEG